MRSRHQAYWSYGQTLTWKKNKVGIYSRPVKLGDKLNDGDRVEIYRPLIADPKELRRQRVEQAKVRHNQRLIFVVTLGSH